MPGEPTLSASEIILRHVGFPLDHFGESRFYRPVGCEDCRGRHLGRVGIFEDMPVTEEVGALGRSRSSAEEIGRAAAEGSMARMRGP